MLKLKHYFLDSWQLCGLLIFSHWGLTLRLPGGGSNRPPPKIFRIFSENPAISDPAFFANEQLFKPVLMQKTRPKSGIGCPRNRGPKKIGRGGGGRCDPGCFWKLKIAVTFFLEEIEEKNRHMKWSSWAQLSPWFFSDFFDQKWRHSDVICTNPEMTS